MQRLSKILFRIIFIFCFLAHPLYSPPIAVSLEASNSKIGIFYKGAKKTSKEKSLLSRGDALLTGTNIQISIEGLDIGSYTLLMERNGKERTTLAEKIKIDKK